MNLLLLGPDRPRLVSFLKECGDCVVRTEELLHTQSSLLTQVDFLVSFNYRHIIRKHVLDQFYRKSINLHIALLPWNRGADPNLWSFLDDTPKGVTIHYLDEGVDTGDVLVQEEITFGTEETLRSSYHKLDTMLENLFCENWHIIRNGNIVVSKQQPGGSYHRLRDKEKFLPLLTEGWDTPVKLLVGKAKGFA